MKKLIIVLLTILISVSAYASPPKGGKRIGQDHGKGQPLMYICYLFDWYDWRFCHSRKDG